MSFAAVALFATTIAPAGASTTVPPPSGTLKCKIDGTGTLSPALPSSTSVDGSPGSVKFKVKGTISDCTGSVTGGKMPITSGAFQFGAVLPQGSSCGDFTFMGPDVTSNPNKLGLKWDGTTATGKHSRVANTTGDVFDLEQIPLGWQLISDPFAAGTAFANETATINLVLGAGSPAWACAFGGPDLKSISFTSAAGSSVSVAP